MTYQRQNDHGTAAGEGAPVTLWIDGVEVSVPEGSSVMHAASVIDRPIPKLCATDMVDPWGSCRMCLVEVKPGPPKPQASCALPATEGQEIRTDSEMVKHAEITQRTGTAIYFADPHSPWQRGSNENTNGLLRQYLPKGTDLSTYTQEELDEIADSLNTRPRETLNAKTPLDVYAEVLQKSVPGSPTLQ